METPQNPVEIPLNDLSPDALAGIIDNFVQREGTDYGVEEVSYEAKIRQVRKQLEKGDVVIVYDPNTESVHLLSKPEFKKLSKGLFA